MEEPACGRPVEKYLYLSVFGLRRLRILGVFYALHSSPKPGPYGAVARVGITAQTNPLLRTLEIWQFCSLDPLDFGLTLGKTFSGKYRPNERPHQEPADT